MQSGRLLRVTAAIAALALVAACSALPPPFGVDPPALGPVVEIAHGGSGASAWTLRAWRSARGLCVQLNNVRGCGDYVPSGRGAMSIGGGGSDGHSWLDGEVAPRVASVRVEFADGTSVVLTPIAPPAGSGISSRFVAMALPSGARPTAYIALDAAGAVLERIGVQSPPGEAPSP